jgi:N-methylhydantoinase A
LEHQTLIGIDVGGTFTDIVGLTPAGRLVVLKTPSTPREPSRAVLEGVGLLAAELETSVPSLLRSASIVHGTTIGLNTLLTRTGARTALLTTAGFRDILEMRLGFKDERYDLAKAPPRPLVPRRLRMPIRERIEKTGAVSTELAEKDVRSVCRFLADEQVEAVAICFLWSFLNPAHELAAAEICAEMLPDAYVSTSWDVHPELREYDRVSTTVLNAYIGPRVASYTTLLEAALEAAGFGGSIHYLQSNGGMAGRHEVMRAPVRTLMSGPAAGPSAARFFAQAAQTDNYICVDMGGTSFDASVVSDGIVRQSRPNELDSVRIGLPMIDIHSVGGGGGSIAHLEAGLLRVGPRSAGAVPGPASYGLGGTEPTVTDASLVLGVYESTSLAAGLEMKRELAVHATGELADAMGLDIEHTAKAVWEVVNLKVSDVLREITVMEGRDPRAYLLVAGGGCGPTHCCELAEQLGIRSVLVPRVASALCAFGCLVTDLVYDGRRSFPMLLRGAIDTDRIDTVLGALEGELVERMTNDGVEASAISVERSLDLRYRDQLWEIPVPIASGPVSRATIDTAIARFHSRHYELYTYSEVDNVCELVGLVVRASAHRARPSLEWPTSEATTWEPSVSRHVAVFAGSNGKPHAETPVFDGSRAPVGVRLDGPALISAVNTVVLVRAGWSCTLESYGAYRLERN